jgi:hypothetical protein
MHQNAPKKHQKSPKKRWIDDNKKITASERRITPREECGREGMQRDLEQAMAMEV